MADGLLVVNFSALQKASIDIDVALRTLDSKLTQLEEDASRLIDTWDGEARSAYEVRQKRWRTASRDLQNILRDIKMAVAESADDYRNTERANTNLFQ